jgi:hypothetical protein
LYLAPFRRVVKVRAAAGPANQAVIKVGVEGRKPAFGLAVTRMADRLLTVPTQVFGVGGGGSNAVNNMVKADIHGIEFWVANTDAQVSAPCSLCQWSTGQTSEINPAIYAGTANLPSAGGKQGADWWEADTWPGGWRQP